MRLSRIHTDHETLADFIKRVIPYSRPVNMDDYVSFKVTAADLCNKIIHVLKKFGWQVHSISKKLKDDTYYVAVTPIHGTPYSHKQQYLFHVTDKSNVNSILRNGLLLKSDGGGMIYPRRVYVYPTYEAAFRSYYISLRLRRMFNRPIDPVLLKIDNSNNKYKLFIDPEYVHSGNEFNDVDNPTFLKTSISPDDIKVMEVDQNDIKKLDELRGHQETQ